MADFFTSDVLYEIFCLPGIYHRIFLIRYINDISISENKLAKIYKFSKIDELYIPYEETYFEEKNCEKRFTILIESIGMKSKHIFSTICLITKKN